MTNSATLMHFFFDVVRKYGDKIALGFKERGSWVEWTWLQYYEKVLSIAKALIALQLEDNDVCLILAKNRKEWVLSHLGILFSGGIPAGIYPTSSSKQCAYFLEHSRAKVLFVENDIQLQKILSLTTPVLHLQYIVLMESEKSLFLEDERFTILSWDVLLRNASRIRSETVYERIHQKNEASTATLVYTSGTTSEPKAVMLTHKNIASTARRVIETVKVFEYDRILSYLPLSHIAEQMISIYGALHTGFKVYFAESLEALPSNLKEVKPTLFFGVPRVWEKIEFKLKSRFKEQSFLKKMMLHHSMKLFRGKYFQKRSLFSKIYDFFPDPSKLFSHYILNKIKNELGFKNCRSFFTAAAPIGQETLEFFSSLDMPLYEIYGLSETTGPVTLSHGTAFKLGCVGKVLPETNIQLAEDGEILVQGPQVFPGYFHDQNASVTSFTHVLDSKQENKEESVWFKTGDLGVIDQEGYLKIIGRKKNLIITAGGENIPTEMLETKILMIPEIEYVVVIGDQRKYLTALLSLREEVLAQLLKNHLDPSCHTVQDLYKSSLFEKYMYEKIGEVNKDLAQVQQIKKIIYADKPFSEENGEITPTQKVKRSFILNLYKEKIEASYQ